MMKETPVKWTIQEGVKMSQGYFEIALDNASHCIHLDKTQAII